MRPEFCVLVRILRCDSCALPVSFVVFILCALSRRNVCVLYLSSCAVIPVRRVWLIPVCSRLLCIPVSCAAIQRSICLLCGVHSVCSMYPCMLFTLVQCVCALSLLVCYYSLCCVKLIPVCSCVTFRGFLRVSCEVFSTLCLSPLCILF